MQSCLKDPSFPLSQSLSQASGQDAVFMDSTGWLKPQADPRIQNEFKLKRTRPDQTFQRIPKDVKRSNHSTTYTYDSSQAEDSDVHFSATNSVGGRLHHANAGRRGSHASSPVNLCCAESDVFSENSDDSLADDLQSQQSPALLCPPAGTTQPSHLINPTPSPTTTLPRSSSGTIDDGLLSPELTDMLRVLYTAESQRDIKPDYLTANHGAPGKGAPATQEAIHPHMRKTIVSWLVEVSTEFKFHTDTLYLTISLLDRFLSVTKAVPRSKLQLIGVACAMIAAKHEEEQHPPVTAFVDIAANCFKAEDLLRMEGIVLSAVGFRVNAPTSLAFFSIFKQALELSPTTVALSSYLMELALLEYDMLSVLPSQVAAAALSLAITRIVSLTQLQPLAALVPAPLETLQPYMQALRQLEHLAGCTNSLQAACTPIKDKYAAVAQ